MGSGTIIRVGCVFFGLLVILAIVLLSLSLKTLAFDEAAVVYNTVSRNVDSTVYTNGLHAIGPSGQYITFKITQREALTNNFPFLTQDSIFVTMDVAIFYTPKQANIIDIIAKWYDQAGHNAFINRTLLGVVRSVASTIPVKQFYTNRQDVQNKIFAAMQAKAAAINLYISVDSLQLLDVQLPSVVLQALVNSINAQQDITNAQSERDSQIQAASNVLANAPNQAAITLINAAKDVALIQQSADTAVQVEVQKMQARSDSFSNISAGLGLGGEFFVQSYLKYLVTQSNAGNTIVGV